MVKTIIKITLGALLFFLLYKAAVVYSVYKAGKYASECTSMAKLCALAERRASNEEVAAAMATAYACIQEKQSFAESWIFPISENFLNPPPDSVTYRDVEKSCRQ